MRFLFRPQVLAICGGLIALVSVLNAAELTVSWDDNSSNESGFRIERAVSGAQFSLLTTVAADVTSFRDTTALAGTTYAYRVAAFTANATSSFSNVAEAAVPQPIGGSPAPANPTAKTPDSIQPDPQIISAPSKSSNTAPTVNASRLVNLSVRAVPASGDRALIVGFVVSSAAKNMLIRAVGPGLSTYTSAAVFSDPKLIVYQGSTMVVENDNWTGSDVLKTTFSRVGAFPLPDASNDAVVSKNLPANAYTATLNGSGSGLAMAELYDADAENQPNGRLVNVSARAHAAPGDGVLIVGFVIAGDTPLRVLVRAVGPTLKNSGITSALADPQLNVYQGGTLVGQNSDWGGTQDLRDVFARVGASGLADAGSKDAALTLTLSPGAYTAVVSGVGTTEGTALAEVYEVP
jgi:hypothetical protein